VWEVVTTNVMAEVVTTPHSWATANAMADVPLTAPSRLASAAATGA